MACWTSGAEGTKGTECQEARLEKLVEAAVPLRFMTAIVGYPPIVEDDSRKTERRAHPEERAFRMQ